ncbi:hypothetical protein SAMN02910264_02031 [Ruminococcaceae bacterium YAD3003]|nr:hypothetical protein SAMN02910264_02031 [Ruminococcaceae bacterium YAD3003]
MELKRSHKILSFCALALLLCPYSAATIISFAVIVLFLALNFFKSTVFKEKTGVTLKQLIVSFLVNIALLSVFIMRWTQFLDPLIVTITGFVLCLLATPILPVIISCYSIKTPEIKLTDKKLGISDHIIFLVSSILILLFISSASPLIAENWECDANCIYTAAQGMVHGKLIYRDLIELKGILMYVIFAAGALITPYSFTGLWILEIVFCYLFMVISAKIQLLFVEKKSSVNSVITAIFTALLYSCTSFDCGNTAEEYGIVFLALILYLCLRFIADDNIRFLKVFIVGILTGIIFWIKYSMCGAVFGIALFFIFYLIWKKQVKQLLTAVAGVLTGFVTVSLPIVLVYFFNGALYELFDVYFGMNIFKYHVTETRGSIFEALANPLLALPSYLSDNSQMLILIVVALVFLFCRHKKYFAFFAAAFSLSFYVALLGNGSVVYYPFIFVPFAMMGTIPLNVMITKFLSEKKKPVRVLSVLASIVLAGMYSFPFVKNTNYYGVAKEEFPTYEFSKIMKNSDDSSFICFGLLDFGFYRSMETDPQIPCFAVLVHDQDMVDEQIRYIEENDYNYIIISNNCNYNVFTDEKNVFKDYELIAMKEDPFYEGDEFYLFRKVRET